MQENRYSLSGTNAAPTGPRPGARADAAAIGELVLLSAEHFLPAVFGPRIRSVLGRLAGGRGTLFSHEHALVVDCAGRVGGMLLGYSASEKSAQDPATGLALFRALGPGMVTRLVRLLRLRRTIGSIAIDQWYVSNVAVFPELRSRGTGRLLMAAAEQRARAAGALDMVLDVETDNQAAIGLYRSLGYETVGETSPLVMEGQAFAFFRMRKRLP